MKVYKISPFWKYFFLIIFLSIYFLIGYFAVLPLYDNPDLHKIIAFLLPLIYLCGAIFIYVYISGQSNLIIVIDDEKIRQENDNIYKEWFFDEIKGYRILQNSILLETNNLSKGKLNISSIYDNYKELKSWILANYNDLDKQDKRDELREIKELSTEELNFKNAKKTAKVVNIIGGIIGVSTIFLVEFNYQIPIYASIIFFPICILVLKYYKGLIKIDVTKNSEYTSLALALILSSFGICIRALLDFNLLKIGGLFIPILVISSVLIGLFLLKNNISEIVNKKQLIYFFFLILMCFAYAYGSFVTLNCMNDVNTETYTTKVLDKRRSGGKTTSYYLKLNKWEKNNIVEEATVNIDFYKKVEVNDIVTLTYGEGAFEIPWYYVNE